MIFQFRGYTHYKLRVKNKITEKKQRLTIEIIFYIVECSWENKNAWKLY